MFPDIQNGSYFSDEFFAGDGRLFRTEGFMNISHSNTQVLYDIVERRLSGDRFVVDRHTNQIIVSPLRTLLGDTGPTPVRAVAIDIPVMAERRDDILVTEEAEVELHDVEENETLVPPTRVFQNTAEEEGRYPIVICGVFNNEIALKARNVDELQKKFDELMNQLLKIRRTINESMPHLNNPDVSRLIESIHALSRHGKIETVFIKRGEPTLCVQTRSIITSSPVMGSRRLVGKMFIEIPIRSFVGDAPDVSKIRIFNMTHVIVIGGGRKFQAPHVAENGSTCYGSSMQLVFDAMVAKDACLTMDALIQFLEQPNVNDGWGQCAMHLPFVAERQ
jgi:hypothetical protein